MNIQICMEAKNTIYILVNAWISKFDHIALWIYKQIYTKNIPQWFVLFATGTRSVSSNYIELESLFLFVLKFNYKEANHDFLVGDINNVFPHDFIFLYD